MTRRDQNKSTLARVTLRPDDVAQITGIGRDRVYQLLKSGEMGSIRSGNRFIITARALDEFLNTRTNKPITATASAA